MDPVVGETGDEVTDEGNDEECRDLCVVDFVVRLNLKL